MLRRRLFSVLTLLAVLLLSSGANVSHAGRCCRVKQKSSCSACQPFQKCCQPCEEICCGTRAGCICIDGVFYGFPGYYLHYAKSYPNSTNCTNFTTIIHQHPTILSPTSCEVGNCISTAMYSDGGYCLPAAADPKYDIDLRIMAPDYEARQYLMGTVKLPNGTNIVARVLLLKIKVGKPQSQHTETFAFGLEAKELPSGTNDDLGGMQVTNHQGGTCLYEGTVLGDIPCFIMTTKH